MAQVLNIPRHETTEFSVSTPSLPYREMEEDWELPDALWGGTRKMREEGQKYLPKEPKESETAYQNRLKRTFLLNLYKRTIVTISGLPFIKPVTITNAPKELEYLEFNADGAGRSITEVAYDMVVNSLHLGKSHALVDFPIIDTEGMSLGQFREENPRPYISIVDPKELIGWRTDDAAKYPTLKQVRFTAESIVPSDLNEWADKEVHYVYVMHRDRTDIYRYDTEFSEDYGFYDSFTNTLGKIPLVTSYGNKTGFMKSYPPLMDLAYKNLEHYQSASDQRHILHVARVPFMLATGFPEDELENAEIGPNRIISASDPDADIKHVEHTGQAIGAGAKDIDKLEEQMGMLGADLLTAKGADRQTATARKIDQSESLSTLQLTLRSVERAIEVAYQMAGEWIGVDAEDVQVSIGDDLSIANEPNPTNALVTLLDSGLITDQQAADEAKRQGILSSYFKLSPDRPSAQEPRNMDDAEVDEMISKADQETNNGEGEEKEEESSEEEENNNENEE